MRSLASAVALGAALALLAGGCGAMFSTPPVRGKGPATTRTLPAPAEFHALRVEGAVEVELTESPDRSLVVVADDNLHALLETSVSGGTLLVRTKGSWESDRPFLVRVGGRAVDAIEASGAVKVRATAMRGDAATVRANGASNVSVAAIAARELVANASGASVLEVAGDVTAKVSVDAGGASKVTAVLRPQHADVAASGAAKVRGISSATSKVQASGSATVDVDVREKLVADASGSASIFYGGDPKLEGAASSASRVQRK